MRKVVLQMMTSLNGRIDDPDAWVGPFEGDLYTEINKIYATFDVVLVGTHTYKEMADYWPGAETEEGGSENNKTMARKMNTCKKVVFSSQPAPKPLGWNNVEWVTVQSDDDIAQYIRDLKAQPGGVIHVSGGARLAQTVTRLGLVDEYHLYVFPVVSAGKAWFDQIQGNNNLELLSATTFENGVVGLYYVPKRAE